MGTPPSINNKKLHVLKRFKQKIFLSPTRQNDERNAAVLLRSSAFTFTNTWLPQSLLRRGRVSSLRGPREPGEAGAYFITFPQRVLFDPPPRKWGRGTARSAVEGARASTNFFVGK
jgi:hypothetical protein